MDNKKLLNPKYASYSAQSSRLQSFDTWPQGLSQNPEEMANAGFFYTGKCDEVICYFCGGKFKDWGSENSPWTEHARWFQFCPYVLLMKGENYIKSIINESSGILENCQKNGNETDDSKSILKYIKETSTLLCKICLMEEVSVCYRPCGHAVTCTKCALSLNKLLCPICRRTIDSVIRIYLS